MYSYLRKIRNTALKIATTIDAYMPKCTKLEQLIKKYTKG